MCQEKKSLRICFLEKGRVNPIFFIFAEKKERNGAIDVGFTRQLKLILRDEK